MLVLTLLLEQQQGILTKAAGISIVFQNVIYKNFQYNVIFVA